MARSADPIAVLLVRVTFRCVFVHQYSIHLLLLLLSVCLDASSKPLGLDCCQWPDPARLSTGRAVPRCFCPPYTFDAARTIPNGASRVLISAPISRTFTAQTAVASIRQYRSTLRFALVLLPRARPLGAAPAEPPDRWVPVLHRCLRAVFGSAAACLPHPRGNPRQLRTNRVALLSG